MNAKEIRELRIKAGANQEEFAELLNVTRFTVSNWERGDKTPKPKHIKTLQEISEVVDEMALEELFKHIQTLGQPTSDNPIRYAVEKAKAQCYAECERLGCDPEIGIIKGAMRTPFIPCWLLNEDIR